MPPSTSMIALARPGLKPPYPATILARMTDTPKPRRRWLRYSLITLMVLVVSASIAMSWVAFKMQGFTRRQEAMGAILNSGGGVQFDFGIDQSGNPLPKPSHPGSAWLRYLMGNDDLGANVVEAEVQADAALEGVKDLPQLRRLHLFSKGITDTGLQRLEQLPQLETLFIEKTQVTEQGVQKFRKALPHCRIIR